MTAPVAPVDVTPSAVALPAAVPAAWVYAVQAAPSQ